MAINVLGHGVFYMFTHLHVHSEYSLLDGACKIKELLDAVKSRGETGIAVTDHGAMYGAMEFYKQAKKRGIKPIIGCEMYVAARSLAEKTRTFDYQNSHLVLLCKDITGYKNLCKLVSISHTDGFYNKPRIDHEHLEKYNEGIIALSACVQGEIPRAILANDYAKAKELAVFYENTFGKENFYLELQNHGIPEQLSVNAGLIKISNETGIPLVATNDVHYVNQNDDKMQEILLLIGTNKTILDDDRMEFKTKEFYLKTEEEMRKLFADVPQAIENTQKIADRCNVEFKFGETFLPHLDIGDVDHLEHFKKQCDNGLVNIIGEIPDEYKKRLEYETNVISKMGFIDYFLIVADFVNFAKNNGIPVGPGRGSGAASLCAYALGITGVDPIKYELIFERFLNPERISMPDFDIDFCYVRRPEVIEYVTKKYGTDCVAQVGALGTLAARAAIKDVGRAMAVSFSDINKVTKLIPFEFHSSIRKAIDYNPELKEVYENDSKLREVIDMAMRVEGMPRHSTTHAAGVVITKEPVNNYLPLARNGDVIITQYNKDEVEQIGLLKMDFLGLRNLTVIDDSVKMVQKYIPDFNINNIDINDEKVFSELSKGYTSGVFQFESAGMRRTVMGLQAKKFEDLIAIISLYRPGPMASIPKYIERSRGKSAVSYHTPLLEPILKSTYGVLVYQEQVLQVLRELAGYSMGQADLVRRAMSKKIHDILKKEREHFINGCQERGVEKRAAEIIFDEIDAFSSYAFPKAHAAPYALIAYRTSYMKTHFPKEYMAALLTGEMGFDYKIGRYKEECSRLGIKVLPPHVNHSFYNFSVDGNDVRFGLQAIKNLGHPLINALIFERERAGKYKSFVDFCERLYSRELNRRALESLIKSGSLDNLDANRNQMLCSIEKLFDSLDADKKRNIEGQMALFGQNSEGEPSFTLPELDDIAPYRLLTMEKEVTGLYLTGHPMDEYAEAAKKSGAYRIDKLCEITQPGSDIKNNQQISAVGIILNIQKKTTKKNDIMAIITIEDMYGSIEALIFPELFSQNAGSLIVGKIIRITGRIGIREFRDEAEPQIVCDAILPPPEPTKKNYKALYLKIPSQNSISYEKVIECVTENKGTIPLVLVFEDTNKKLKSKNIQVNDSKEMLYNLNIILGEDNVKLI